MQKYVLSLFASAVILMVGELTAAQSDPQKLNWIQSGNCWVAEPGFLYCGKAHPYAEVSITPFISFVCFQHYQAVIVGHDPIDDVSTVRVVHSDFGIKEYSSSWVASSPTESFMSNNINPQNEGYRDLLNGLLNPKSKLLSISISPGNYEGEIELIGVEYEVVGGYIEICNDT